MHRVDLFHKCLIIPSISNTFSNGITLEKCKKLLFDLIHTSLLILILMYDKSLSKVLCGHMGTGEIH